MLLYLHFTIIKYLNPYLHWQLYIIYSPVKILQMMKLRFSAVVGCLTVGQILVNLGLYVQNQFYNYFNRQNNTPHNVKKPYHKGRANHFFTLFNSKNILNCLLHLCLITYCIVKYRSCSDILNRLRNLNISNYAKLVNKFKI